MLQTILARLFRRRKPTAEWSLDKFSTSAESRKNLRDVTAWLKSQKNEPKP